MKPHSELSDRLRLVLKQALKSQGISYRAVAQYLGVSLPTVKRTFSSEEIPFQRLSRIGELIGMNVVEIFQACEKQPEQPKVPFTLEQEQAFADDPELFSYFAAIVSDPNPEKLASKYKLTKLTTRRYLSKLENLGLLQSTNDSSIQIRKKFLDGFTFRSNGPWMRRNVRTMIGALEAHFVKRMGNLPRDTDFNEEQKARRDFRCNMSQTMGRRATYDELLVEMRDLIDRYQRRFTVEQKLTSSEKELVPVVIGVFLDHADVLKSALINVMPHN